MEMITELKPGSPAAILHGCTCAVEDNQNGEGAFLYNGKPMYFVSSDCPLHGEHRTYYELPKIEV